MLYHHLTPAERLVIDSMCRAGFSQKAIANALGRSRSTISCELRRNRDTISQQYCPHWARIRYWKRREQVVNAHKAGNAALMEYIVAKLEMRWSPEQIAGRLRHVVLPKRSSFLRTAIERTFLLSLQEDIITELRQTPLIPLTF
jgi:IS30 family transposase